MTSFALRESLHYARENGSATYMCFLDGKQAFDHVWHDGLFFKLIEYGIDSTTLLALRNMYSNSRCQVKHQGLLSTDFLIRQGTKQGGKSSPLLYLVFINGLIKELEASNKGLCFYEINFGSPTVADDMVLMSFSKKGLEQMLHICWLYSCKWRYYYNAQKCKILIFNDKRSTPPNQQHFMLGQEVLELCESYCHLGVTCEKHLSVKSSIKEACVKLRGSFFSAVNGGLHPGFINPRTLRVIYQSVVLPKALYGCEFWSTYTKSDIDSLEKAHRHCIKHIQTFFRCTSTDFSLCCLGSVPIETLIDYRKLQLFGQLCRLSSQYLAKVVFVQRLIRFVNGDRQTMGFIPDLYRLFSKYSLGHYPQMYLLSARFPSKYAWKAILTKTVIQQTYCDMVDRLCSKGNEWLCDSLIPIHVVRGSSSVWQVARNNPSYLALCTLIMKFVGEFISRQYVKVCHKCCLSTENLTEHLLCYCVMNNILRQKLRSLLIDSLGYRQYVKFIKLNPIEQCKTVLKTATNNDSVAFSTVQLTITVGNMFHI